MLIFAHFLQKEKKKKGRKIANSKSYYSTQPIWNVCQLSLHWASFYSVYVVCFGVVLPRYS